ncbi:MAG: FliM/FliN family flagellar motor C-terminal domain-containing protein, partial [Planctomycetota bacterium]
ELHLETPAGQSSLRIYLPIFDAQLAALPRARTAALPSHLPNHLRKVDVLLSAQLGLAELPLNDLLNLEVGDVLSLDARYGDPLRIVAEERELGLAELGSHRGLLALRVAQWNQDPLLTPSEPQADATPKSAKPKTESKR